MAITQVALLVAVLIAPAATLAEEPPPNPVAAAALSTDKADYAPGETVLVSGTGFEPTVTYAIPVQRPDASIVIGDGSFTAGWDTATADPNGALTYSYQLNGIAGAYEVRTYATDWSGDWTAAPIASATFTDSVVPVPNITISGNKFHDLNANGTFQLNNNGLFEPALGGWQVDLLNFQTGAVVGTTTSASPSGAYQFVVPSLGAGAYYLVCEVLKPGWTQTRPYSGATAAGGAAVAAACPSGYATWGWKIGADGANVNFGNINLVATGTKFDDLNADGFRDAGEPGLAGVTIKAYDPTGAVEKATAVTDANGDYSLTLPPTANSLTNSYLICEFPTAGRIQSAPTGTACSGVSGAAAGGHAITIAAASGTSQAAPGSIAPSSGNDFANYLDATKSGFKFHDLNANGTWDDDSSEGPLSGWWIYVLDPTNTTNVIASQVTGADGSYAFTLTPGQYLVCEEAGTDWYQSRPWDAGSNLFGTWTAACPDPYADFGWLIDLESGDEDTLNNFGNYHYASKAGSVFHDRDADGAKNGTDSWLAGWTVNLVGTDGAGNPVSDSTLTDVNGAYLFDDLVPGDYTISLSCPAASPGWRQSLPDPTSDAITDCGTGTHVVSLTSGEADTGNDFGVYHNATKSGWKFEDLDADGVWDEGGGEPGINGWTIVALQNGQVESLTTMFGGDAYTFVRDGYYQFSLKPGTWLICEELPAGWLQSRPPGAGQTLFGTLTAACPAPYAPYGWQITLKSGDADTLNNFGNFEYASKSGVAFLDKDADGTKDPADVGLEGWTVTLTGTTGKGAPVGPLTDLTDNIGAYAFPDLVPGTYTIAATCPVNERWRQTTPVATSEGPADCGTGTHVVTLISGQADSGNDFGFYQYATKSGTKFHDLNANGVWDEGIGGALEPVLGGFTIVALTGVDWATEAATTTTAADGSYSFSLKPGEYLFCEVMPTPPPTWYQSRPPGVGTFPYGGLAAECPAGYGEYGWRETLTSGGDYPLNNFGNYQLATKWGYKFHDINENGVWNDGLGEPGLEGWKIVALTGTSWSTVAATMYTDENGYYEFNLRPGEYLFCEVTNGWQQSRPDGVLDYPYGGWSAECPAPYAPYGWRETLVSGEEYTWNNFGNFWGDTSMFTSSSFCTLDEFRLVYHMDTPSTWRLQASNPGQFYYNVAVHGTPGASTAVDITIPYPFVTQGSQPIQVRDFVTDAGGDGCFEFASSLNGYTVTTADLDPTSPSGAQIVGFEDYSTRTIGSSTVVTVSGVIPATGLMVVTIHLDYGLKKTAGWARSLEIAQGNPSYPGVVINEPQPYDFSFDASGQTAGSQPNSENEFKKIAGFAGILQSLATGDPIVNGQVKIYSPTGSLLGTAYTDADGYYVLAYKHKSKSATYTIKAPAWGLVGKVTIKANGFGVVNFDTP